MPTELQPRTPLADSMSPLLSHLDPPDLNADDPNFTTTFAPAPDPMLDREANSSADTTPPSVLNIRYPIITKLTHRPNFTMQLAPTPIPEPVSDISACTTLPPLRLRPPHSSTVDDPARSPAPPESPPSPRTTHLTPNSTTARSRAPPNPPRRAAKPESKRARPRSPTLVELKDTCRRLKLPVSGKKSALKQRIAATEADADADAEAEAEAQVGDDEGLTGIVRSLIPIPLLPGDYEPDFMMIAGANYNN